MAPDRKPGFTTFKELAFRYSNYDTPFWVRPNSEPGRWHDVGDGPTQYLSTTVEAAWAELIRAEAIGTDAEATLVRMPMWVAEVHIQRIADYSTFETAETGGFPPDALIDDDHSRCQVEGRRLRTHGYQGVLAPSAALPGALSLTLFGPRIASLWQIPPLLASSTPATRLAVGAPPEEIVDRVRRRGEPHAGYQAFRKARRTEKRET